MTANQSIHIIVITTPERLEQEWIEHLASEPTITRVDRVGVVQAGLDLVRQWPIEVFERRPYELEVDGAVLDLAFEQRFDLVFHLCAKVRADVIDEADTAPSNLRLVEALQ